MPSVLRGLVALIVLGCASGSIARGDIFVRPSAQYLSYTTTGFSEKKGLSLAGGLALGDGSHELGLEVAQADWDLSILHSNLALGAFLGTTGNGRITPVLASYRYILSGTFFRVYLGTSAGATRVSGDARVALSGVGYGGTLSAWRKTLAGSAGISIPLGKAFSLEGGYRYLTIQETKFSSTLFASTTPGPTLTLDKIKAHVIEAGARFTF